MSLLKLSIRLKLIWRKERDTCITINMPVITSNKFKSLKIPIRCFNGCLMVLVEEKIET